MRRSAMRAPGDPAFRRRILAWLVALWLLRTGIRLGIRAARRPHRDHGSELETTSPDRQG